MVLPMVLLMAVLLMVLLMAVDAASDDCMLLMVSLCAGSSENR